MITDEMVFAVEEELGMGHGAWDTINPHRILQASLDVVLARLSPSTRDLLLSNPEAVEACVVAVMAEKAFAEHSKQSIAGEYCDECSRLTSVSAHAMEAAMTALPKE